MLLVLFHSIVVTPSLTLSTQFTETFLGIRGKAKGKGKKKKCKMSVANKMECLAPVHLQNYILFSTHENNQFQLSSSESLISQLLTKITSMYQRHLSKCQSDNLSSAFVISTPVTIIQRRHLSSSSFPLKNSIS